MYQRPEGLSHLIAPQMHPEGCGRGQDALRDWERKEAAPAPFFTILVAFLKGYIQGHVTFRGLNKKKNLFYCKMCFSFYSPCAGI